MKFPEFEPQSYKRGEVVQVRRDGQVIDGRVIRQTAAGNYWIENQDGHEILVEKNDVFPGQETQVQQQQANAGQPSTVRFYHGGGEYNGGPRWLTPHYNYAKGYADKNSNPVHYVDIEENDPILQKSIAFTPEDTGESLDTLKKLYGPSLYTNFEVPEEVAKRLQILHGPNVNDYDPKSPSVSSPSAHSSTVEAVQVVPQSEPVKPTFQNPTEGAAQTFVDSARSDGDYDPFVLQSSERDQVEKPQQVDQENQLAPSSSTPNSIIDAVQSTLDAAGVVDPTPVSDGTNAILSLGRAIKNPRSAGKHLKNAAISAVSMIPYIGDLAKGVKYSGKAAKAAKSAKNASEVAEAAEAVKAVDNASSVPGGGDFNTKEFVESIFGRNSSGDGRSGGSGGSSGSGGSGGSGGGPRDPNSPGDPDDENIRKNLGGFKDAVVDVTGKLGKLGVSVYAFAEAQNFLNRAVIEFNRNLLKYNGELTKAYSELDFGRLSREFRQAQKQAGPMSGLIGAQNDLEESMMNFRGDWQVIATDIQTGLTKLADIGIRVLDYISPLEEMYGLIRKWLPWGKPDTQKFDGNAAIKELDAWRNKVADAQNRGRKV